jgi:hypothetical protein
MVFASAGDKMVGVIGVKPLVKSAAHKLIGLTRLRSAFLGVRSENKRVTDANRASSLIMADNVIEFAFGA